MPATEHKFESGAAPNQEWKARSKPRKSAQADTRDEVRVIIHDVLGDFSEQTGAAFG